MNIRIGYDVKTAIMLIFHISFVFIFFKKLNISFGLKNGESVIKNGKQLYLKKIQDNQYIFSKRVTSHF